MKKRAPELWGFSVVLVLSCPRKEEHGGGEGHAQEAKPS